MYLSCLLVEDGIRHLFLYQSISVSFSSFTLLRVFSSLIDSALALVDLLSALCLVSYHTTPIFPQSYLGRQFYLAAATLATVHATRTATTVHYALLPYWAHPFPCLLGCLLPQSR